MSTSADEGREECRPGSPPAGVLPEELEPDRFGLWRSAQPKVVLTIGGLDPSGGAGVIADLNTLASNGIYGMAIVATLTVQNTRGMYGRYDVPAEVVGGQLQKIFDDRRPNAVKTGALGSRENVLELGYMLEKLEYPGPLVVDPVLASSGGVELFDDRAVEALVEALLPRATVLTPNASEVNRLCGFQVFDVKDMEAAALRLTSMGARSVLITGGRLEEKGRLVAADVFCENRLIEVMRSPWLQEGDVHGTGCLMATAIAAGLARGKPARGAVHDARISVRQAMEAPVFPGQGRPVANPFAVVKPRLFGRKRGGRDASRIHQRYAR